MVQCVFTCPVCGTRVGWDNSRENEPKCPRCSGSNSGPKGCGKTAATILIVIAIAGAVVACASRH